MNNFFGILAEIQSVPMEFYIQLISGVALVVASHFRLENKFMEKISELDKKVSIMEAMHKINEKENHK